MTPPTPTFTAVLPYVYRPYYFECVATMHPDFLANLLPVDNTAHNIGIMASHNLGIERVLERGQDWLIILSAAIRFGAPGGMDFVGHLANHSRHIAVEAQGVYGQHCIAYSRDTLETVGLFDLNFSNYGFDDLDYSFRIRRAYPHVNPYWSKVPVDVTDMGMGHSIKMGLVDAPAGPRLDYLCAKWSIKLAADGGKSEPGFDHPFDDESKPVSWFPMPPDPRSIL